MISDINDINDTKNVDSVIISGYFNPIGRHHILYAKHARELVGPNGKVYCIVNSDHQVKLKKGFKFIPENDRLATLDNIKYIDKAFLSIDKDRSVNETVKYIVDNSEFKPTIFFNEGDCNPEAPCAEEQVCRENNIKVVYGTRDKIQSSSWILADALKEAHVVLNLGGNMIVHM
jgi:glycerol-3-phosphate cytidylyltransferase-like family protein